MIIILMVLAFLYPRFGFTTRRLTGNLLTDREAILAAIHRNGYSVVSESANEWTLRASSPAKKLILMWEERLTITQQGDELVIDGIRKEVVRLVFRLSPALEQSRSDRSENE